jgi:hypothetical protein
MQIAYINGNNKYTNNSDCDWNEIYGSTRNNILFHHRVETYGSHNILFRRWIESHDSQQHFVPPLYGSNNISYRHWVERYGSKKNILFPHWVKKYGSQNFVPQLGKNIWLRTTFYSATG